MARLVLTDASPLIGLGRINGVDWLRSLFGTVWMPPEVRQEVLPGRGLADEAPIAAAEAAGWLRQTIPSPAEPELPDLDEGEAACIRIALAHPEPSLLLMDERAGRAIAAEHGLQVAGTAAVVGMAKTRGLVGSARQVFARLHGSDFRISAQVIETVLKHLRLLLPLFFERRRVTQAVEALATLTHAGRKRAWPCWECAPTLPDLYQREILPSVRDFLFSGANARVRSETLISARHGLCASLAEVRSSEDLPTNRDHPPSKIGLR